jgi:hypothetical protein
MQKQRRMISLKCTHNVSGPISRPVVDNDNASGPQSLRKDRCDALVYETLPIMYGNDHVDIMPALGVSGSRVLRTSCKIQISPQAPQELF